MDADEYMAALNSIKKKVAGVKNGTVILKQGGMEYTDREIATRLRTCRGANVLAGYGDRELADALLDWCGRYGGEPIHRLRQMERGDLEVGGLIDFIRAPKTHDVVVVTNAEPEPAPRPKGRHVSLPIERRSLRLRIDERPLARTFKARDHADLMGRWVLRSVRRNGDTLINGTTVTMEREGPSTLLDMPKRVVHTIWHVIPFGQTEGLPEQLGVGPVIPSSLIVWLDLDRGEPTKEEPSAP